MGQLFRKSMSELRALLPVDSDVPGEKRDLVRRVVEAGVVDVYDTEDDVLEKSAANLPNCELRLQDEITVSDMLWANQVLFTKPAFDWVNERYGA